MSTGVNFSLGNAFTKDFGGGGPAAVMFLPTLTSYPDATMLAIAKNFNQPMTAFVAKAPTPASEADTAAFGIRWFTIARELPLCGHATLVSAGAIFADPTLIAPSVTKLRFDAPSGSKLVAQKMDDGRIEIALAATLLADLREEDAVRLREALAKTLGEDLKVVNMKWGQGTEGLRQYVLVEVDTPDLGAIRPMLTGLIGSPFVVHIIASASRSPEFAFESRMFAALGDCVFEDPVCGSAHTLLGPYWKAKNNLPNTFRANQVSSRGGDLKVTVDEASGQVQLAGHFKLVGKGEIFP
ncbi:hypothetical protein EVG20_g4618 [Dentipellis fragilis]|uniref:Phenazine biosynthesis protein n=1 Tax=Dentipellis fragilis TaxID=205917 RepID=A0A4Y9YW02_9AGAM|nr:hypothetical protein EVG20_g4618 [Dentipellis fragilis]